MDIILDVFKPNISRVRLVAAHSPKAYSVVVLKQLHDIHMGNG